MERKHLRIISLLLHAIYIIMCAATIVFVLSADGLGSTFFVQTWYISVMVLLPLLLIGLFLNIYAMPRKKSGERGRTSWLSFTIACPVIMCALCFLSSVYLFGQTTPQYDDDIDNYHANIKEYEADLFMPNLDEIDDYLEIDYLCEKSTAFFPSCSMQLIIKYDAQTFLKEKARLETAYTYINEPQTGYGDDEYTIPVESFSAFGFDFKIAKFDNTVYPKNFGMVGISETNHEIAYLWLYFPDLDIICTAKEDRNEEILHFIKEHFSLE